jgi:hemolysin activation/secretion protein
VAQRLPHPFKNGIMNHIYRVVWNRHTRGWQSVSKFGKGLGKTGSSTGIHRCCTQVLAAALFATLLFPLASTVALAQVAPDAGRILRDELNRMPATPRPSKGLDIQTPDATTVRSGGATVELGGVVFAGNSVFSNQQLSAVIGDIAGHAYDLAGLRELADRISAWYRQAGYPFARAFIVPQQLQNHGTLKVDIVEGRYGKVAASGDPVLAASAQPYLHNLQPGSLIESSVLERTTLIMSDLPGVKLKPVIRPGAQLGTGDLDVGLERDKPYSARVGIDNHGNYYSGQWRTRAELAIYSPFMLGDQINLSALYTQENLWLGSAQYSLPVGASGLRANVAYAQTAYALGNGFEGNDGLARVASAGLSYPLVRSQRTNLNLSATWQYKNLYNSYSSGTTTERYHSDSLPLSLGFDHRDTLGGGGVTYGAVTWTHGNLNKDDAVRRGDFNKFNLDLARLQALPDGFTLFTRFSAQWADKNLDSSESMALGGPGGVRAYPLGESSGDEGWLGQVELRYAIGNVTPYVFYDHGRMKINARPSQVTLPSPDETRAGAGIGVRYQTRSWSLDGLVAWRTQGGAPASDTHADPRPRFWLTLGYAF